MAISASGETLWSPSVLYGRLESGGDFFILDVRAEDEYEAWKIEGKRKIPTLNIPYYEMLEVDEHDDVVDTFEDFLSQGTAEKLPREMPVLAVCAKGDTSEFVAEALRRLGFEALNLEGGTQAWGDFYHVETVVSEGDLELLQVSRPARGCLSYVVIRGGEAVLIDPLRHAEHYLEVVAEHVDMVQVGASNMQNFVLLRAVGQTERPVLLKRGPSATIDEWLMAAEYILNEGNMNVVLGEPGIRTLRISSTLATPS